MKHVVVIVGTPCVGKTTVAKQLADRLGALYVNLTDYAKCNGLIFGEDIERCTSIVDEERMRQALRGVIVGYEGSVVVDGHFAASVVSSEFSTCVFVLRRNPVELKEYMKREGFSENKLCENLLAEILDVCFIEAMTAQAGKVCEVDITGKSVEQVLDELYTFILAEKKQFSKGSIVDWLGFLEREGLLSQYIKI
ncbi:MAG: adenylate kinase family protein [Nitrososphaerota archaeon]|jgi:adenylate kinase|nr:adenylate kinase family protein [Nitrososphaerota archaeon]